MSWFDNPNELFRSDKILVFWPNDKQTADERINASTRFILYLACALYLIKRDIRIIVLALMVLGILYVFNKAGVVKDYTPVFNEEGKVEVCQKPTKENPMANVLLTDYADDPNRNPACWYPSVENEVKSFMDDTVDYIGSPSFASPRNWPSTQRNAFARQFISGPVTSIPNDQTAFAEWCYGKKSDAKCRDDPSACDPNYWGAQTEAFAGLDSSGNKRSGMSAR
jgi:hypothetical protein